MIGYSNSWLLRRALDLLDAMGVVKVPTCVVLYCFATDLFMAVVFHRSSSGEKSQYYVVRSNARTREPEKGHESRPMSAFSKCEVCSS